MLRSSCLFVPVLLGFSVAASASKINTSTSSYGSPSDDTVTVLGNLTEQNYDFSFLGGFEVFDFLVNTDVSNFTLTLTGAAPFLADDTSNVPPEFFGFGAFITGSCSTFAQCGPDPTLAPYNATSSLPGSDGTDTKVSFKVAGDGKGLVFFAIEPEGDSGLNNLVTAKITPNTATTPEPRLWPVLGLAFLGLVGFRRFRSAKLA
jgi:hypothetical protein